MEETRGDLNWAEYEEVDLGGQGKFVVIPESQVWVDDSSVSFEDGTRFILGGEITDGRMMVLRVGFKALEEDNQPIPIIELADCLDLEAVVENTDLAPFQPLLVAMNADPRWLRAQMMLAAAFIAASRGEFSFTRDFDTLSLNFEFSKYNYSFETEATVDMEALHGLAEAVEEDDGGDGA